MEAIHDERSILVVNYLSKNLDFSSIPMRFYTSTSAYVSILA